MEQLIKERGQIRQMHDSGSHRLKMEIEVLLTKIEELEKILDVTTHELKRTLNSTQTNKFSQELDSLKKLLSHKDQ
jgi:flagellin-specific chaperone FliS